MELQKNQTQLSSWARTHTHTMHLMKSVPSHTHNLLITYLYLTRHMCFVHITYALKQPYSLCMLNIQPSQYLYELLYYYNSSQWALEINQLTKVTLIGRRKAETDPICLTHVYTHDHYKRLFPHGKTNKGLKNDFNLLKLLLYLWHLH